MPAQYSFSSTSSQAECFASPADRLWWQETCAELDAIMAEPANDDVRPLEPPPAANDESAAAPARVTRFPKKRAARPRSSYARDRRNLMILPGFVTDVRPLVRDRAAGVSVCAPTPTSSPSSTHSIKSEKTLSKSTVKRRKADENDRRAPPPWDRTTDIIKSHAFFRAVSATGAGLAFTLNLGGKVLKAVNDNPADAKAMLHERFANCLKAQFKHPVDFVFRLEATASGRFHVHGAIDANDNMKPGVEEALRKAGGTWDAKHGAEHQVHTEVMWGADGWCRYSAKDEARTKRLLGVKSVLSVTRGCRRRAEELWEAARATHARHVAPRPSAFGY